MLVQEISTEKTIAIRHEVLRKNKPIESCYFTGDNKKNTFHLGVFLDTELVGICTFVENEKAIQQKIFAYQLRGMAVLEKFQHKGVGKAILEFIPDFLIEKGILHIWCNARISAVSFYQKFGFESLGTSFEIPEVGPHLVMTKSYE